MKNLLFRPNTARSRDGLSECSKEEDESSTDSSDSDSSSSSSSDSSEEDSDESKEKTEKSQESPKTTDRGTSRRRKITVSDVGTDSDEDRKAMEELQRNQMLI